MRAAHGVLAATVQQWLTTPARLQEWIELLRPLHVPDRRTADAAPAASSNRPCRATPLTDCEWNLPDGTKIVLEVATSIRGWPPT